MVLPTLRIITQDEAQLWLSGLIAVRLYNCFKKVWLSRCLPTTVERNVRSLADKSKDVHSTEWVVQRGAVYRVWYPQQYRSV
jgi:hypothetical protein